MVSCGAIAQQPSGKMTLGQACEIWRKRASAHAAKEDWAMVEQDLAKIALAGRAVNGDGRLRAYALYRLGRYSEAAAKFDAILQGHPESFAARYYLGRSLYELKHYARAAERLERATEAKQQEADALWYPRADGRALASSELDREVALRLATVYLDWGRALTELKLVGSATPKLDKAIELATRDLVRDQSEDTGASFLYIMASALQCKKVFWNAQEHFEAFVRRFPTHPKTPRAAFEATVCVELGGAPEDCLERYERLIKRYPKSEVAADSLIRIGLFHFDRRRYSRAAVDLERFLKLFPAHESEQRVFFKVCVCFVLDKKYEEAGKRFEQFLQAYPKSDLRPAAYEWAADSYLKADETEKRNQVLDRFEKEFPNHPGPWRRRKLTKPIFDRISEME